MTSSYRIIGIVVLLLGATSGHATAQDDCVRPTEVRDSWGVRSSFLILKSPISTYVIDSNHDCFGLNRNEFSGRLNFSIINRFPFTERKTAYVFIKSIRSFAGTNQQEEKIKLSRGGGWYKDDGSAGADDIDDYPLSISIKEWNGAHNAPGNPKKLNSEIKYSWHAFAETNQSLASTETVSFWKIPTMHEQTPGTITNYLVRFKVNSDEDKRSYANFYVRSQSYVRKIDLTLQSNIGELSNMYRFVLK